jgi:hypothetical protein
MSKPVLDWARTQCAVATGLALIAITWVFLAADDVLREIGDNK